jgi:hypothetical protein
MDEIVRQAMAKWPNVPHCYGWLALDARGNWRMRDERSQALKLAGDRIANAALLAFINRNYTHDDKGRWYFQNGPQRVYINLDATPYIVRTDPQHGFVLHTGEQFPAIDAVWLTDEGRLLFKGGDVIAQLDDRDTVQCLLMLRFGEVPASDERLLEWIEHGGNDVPGDPLGFEHEGKRLHVERIEENEIPARFGFTKTPQPDQ